MVYYTRLYILHWFNIYGFMYISILISSKLTVDLFYLLQFNYKTYKSVYQHILLNLFINSSYIQEANQRNLICKSNYELIF